MPTFQQGVVIFAEICDPTGRNPKIRPVVIITPQDEIESAELLQGVAVSATAFYDDPRPPQYVVLPWQREGRVMTGLNKPCVAVCDWITEFLQDDIDRVSGSVPTEILLTILSNVQPYRPPYS